MTQNNGGTTDEAFTGAVFTVGEMSFCWCGYLNMFTSRTFYVHAEEGGKKTQQKTIKGLL